MNSDIFIAGGCSFTFGSELMDTDSNWSCLLNKIQETQGNYVNTALPGASNSGIARRILHQLSTHKSENIKGVVAMWSFSSRYDWAMPEHNELEDKRWTSITPWDASISAEERHKALAGSEVQQEHWKRRQKVTEMTGVKPFAEAIYRNAANDYHETYLSWKSIIWLQNILEKKKIPFMFTLADNSLFYQDFQHLKDHDTFMSALHSEIDFTKWFSFGERMMGFNQWALMEEYERGTTHPLDKAHEDAVQLMLPTFNKLIGEK